MLMLLLSCRKKSCWLILCTLPNSSISSRVLSHWLKYVWDKLDDEPREK